MLYALLKIIMQATIRVFFRSITVKNKEAIPDTGPLIILANHPATFMDPIVMACSMKRKVYFLAKGSLFMGPFVSWILGRLSIIPIYRKQDDPSLLNKNTDTFKRCYEHLEKGGTIVMYPEGISITERKLKPIKPGASHIALNAEARNDFKLGVKIVNMGLNYEDQHKFNKDLYINIHEPIDIGAYKEKFNADKVETIRELTREIDKQLKELVISVPDEKTDEFVKDIETLYLQQLKDTRGISGKQVPVEFTYTQTIIKAIQYFSAIDPELIHNIQTRIKNYFKHLKIFHLSDTHVTTYKNRGRDWFRNIATLFALILGFPVYLYGLVNNFLPFQIPDWVAAKTKDYRGAIAMVTGIITFSLFYSVQISLVYHYTQNPLWTLLYGISLPLTAFFTLYYWNHINVVKGKWLMIALFYSKKKLIHLLLEERNDIIRLFEKAEKDYLKEFPETE